MAGIAFENSITTGHSTAPPTSLVGSQDLVTLEGRRVLVEGDRIVPHSYEDDPPHTGVVICSNTVVYIMGKKVAQIGDRITCGDTVSEGSSIGLMR